MSKNKLHELLCQLWNRDISADDAFDELEDLINRIKLLEEAGDDLESWIDRKTPFTIRNNWHKAKEAKP